MWSTSNGEQKGAYSLIPFNRLSGNFVDRMGSEAGSPLRAHAFSNCEREGVMGAPFDRGYSGLSETSVASNGNPNR